MKYDTKGRHSVSGGVETFPIATRFDRERERLAGGFTDEDRAWRKKWLKDQILSPNEPVTPEWYYRERFNPIRRAIKWPLNTLFKVLEPKLGSSTPYWRGYTGGFLIMIGTVYVASYCLKYRQKDWKTKSGWAVDFSKPIVPLGHPDFPAAPIRTKPSDYRDRDFKNSPI